VSAPARARGLVSSAIMQPIWTPSAERVKAANVTRFIECLNARRGLKLSGHAELYAWSVAHPTDFWSELARFADVRIDWGNGPALENPGAMPGARFFPSARLNFAENLLRFRDKRPAIVFRNDRGARREVSFHDLHDEVARIAAGLAAAGVGPGDRVAGYLPNLPEAIIAMLATTSLGAVWSSCSPDFGINGVLDRFGQIAPKVLFTADQYGYGGKRFDCLEKIRGVLEAIASIEKLVVVPYSGEALKLDGLRNAVSWPDFAGSGEHPLQFEMLPFDHPLYIMYSSGTTGVPKCIVHGAGGTLIQHLKELVLHTDIKREDRLFYYTTCGWMMWNWFVSGLAAGAALVLYDGSPFHPDGNALWDLADEVGITVFGTSAKWISAIEKAGIRPRATHKLLSLKTILSTGSPLAPESYDYVYRDVKDRVLLASISGGTDIISASCSVAGSA
jgi:acetoacetyl-CoA synthetase